MVQDRRSISNCNLRADFRPQMCNVIRKLDMLIYGETDLLWAMMWQDVCIAQNT